jgi:hypothetical protein
LSLPGITITLGPVGGATAQPASARKPMIAAAYLIGRMRASADIGRHQAPGEDYTPIRRP